MLSTAFFASLAEINESLTSSSILTLSSHNSGGIVRVANEYRGSRPCLKNLSSDTRAVTSNAKYRMLPSTQSQSVFLIATTQTRRLGFLQYSNKWKILDANRA